MNAYIYKNQLSHINARPEQSLLGRGVLRLALLSLFVLVVIILVALGILELAAVGNIEKFFTCGG